MPACDVLSVHCGKEIYATFDNDDPLLVASLLRPQTPIPDDTRTLRRSTSFASIDTIRQSNNNKGVRRRITNIAENLKNKSAAAKKKRKDSLSSLSTSSSITEKDKGRDKNAYPTKGNPTWIQSARGSTDSEGKCPQVSVSSKSATSATARRKLRRVAAVPLRDASQEYNNKKHAEPANEEDRDQAVAVVDRSTSSELNPPSEPTRTVLRSDSLIDVSLLKEDDPWENNLHPNWSLEPAADIAVVDRITFHFDPPLRSQADIEDVQLDIRTNERDMTIWDGLQAAHHVFSCRLFLRCVTQPYDSISLPKIRRFEMDCTTSPVSGTHYARPPVLQTTYQGASPGSVKEHPNVKLSKGIHVDKFWRTILEEDGTWGWYRDAYVPLSSRLFDKMEYRKFKLVCRVWFGESCIQCESTFGISMLLREAEMK